MVNTNVQTIHQMGFGINEMVKQATGRESVSSIEHDWVSVEQLARYIYGSGSGDVVSFETNIQDAIESLIAYITAVQDLHGQESPYPAGGGKNLLPMTLANMKSSNTAGTWNGNVYTYANITYTVNTDSAGNVVSIKANGTANDYSLFRVCNDISFTVDTILNGCPSGGSYSGYKLQADGGTARQDIGSGVTIPANESKTRVIIAIPNGTAVSNILFYPMIRLSTVTDGTFAPYSNICPITGWTGCTVTDTNMLDSSDPDYYADTYTFTFPDEAGTIYGGTLDVLSGVLTIDKAYIKGSSCTWTENGTYANTYNGLYVGISPAVNNDVSGCSSGYVMYTSGTVGSKDYGFATANNNYRLIYVKNKDISSLQDFIAHIADIEFVWTMRTPITYQLTPQQVSSLIGENNIYCSTGSVSVEYKTKEDLL